MQHEWSYEEIKLCNNTCFIFRYFPILMAIGIIYGRKKAVLDSKPYQDKKKKKYIDIYLTYTIR